MSRRQSRAVYRRRRLTLFVIVLVVVALVAAGVWALIAQPWADAAPAPASTASDAAATTDPTTQPTDEATDEPTDQPTDEPTADESPTPNPTTQETPGIASCEASDVKVEALTDAESYAAGSNPNLSIQLSNIGDRDCMIDVGTATQRLTVSSGADIWWRSTDCQENPTSQVMTLAAGQTVTSATPVTWDRTRSSTATCGDENRPRAAGGGASYHVAVEIGGFESATTAQIFLY